MYYRLKSPNFAVHEPKVTYWFDYDFILGELEESIDTHDTEPEGGESAQEMLQQ